MIAYRPTVCHCTEAAPSGLSCSPLSALCLPYVSTSSRAWSSSLSAAVADTSTGSGASITFDLCVCQSEDNLHTVVPFCCQSRSVGCSACCGEGGRQQKGITVCKLSSEDCRTQLSSPSLCHVVILHLSNCLPAHTCTWHITLACCTCLHTLQLRCMTAVQDASILQDMCGEAWIPRSSLHHWRALGSGAFAVVQQCVLKLDNGPGVSPSVACATCCIMSNVVAAQL